MNRFLIKRAVASFAVAAVLGATLIAIPAGASSPPVPSASAVAAALGNAGASAGYATNWSSSGSSPVTATNNGMTVSLPKQATGQVVLSDNGVTIGMGIPDSVGASSAQSIGDATTVYTGGAPDVAVAAQADTTGAREAVTITGPNAPTTYAFPFTVPAGASLVPDANGDGGYTLQSTPSKGVTVQYGTIGAPWAKDANGNPVPTSYSVSGDTLIQTVDFTSSTAFPVVADPMITFGYSVYLNFFGAELDLYREAMAILGYKYSIALSVGTTCALVAGAAVALTSLGDLDAALLAAAMGTVCGMLIVGGYSGANMGSPFTSAANLPLTTCYQYNIFSLPWTKVEVSAANCL